MELVPQNVSSPSAVDSTRWVFREVRARSLSFRIEVEIVTEVIWISRSIVKIFFHRRRDEENPVICVDVRVFFDSRVLLSFVRS